MTQALQVMHFTCPGCNAVLELPAEGFTTCPICGWRGHAYVFSPPPLAVNAAEMALPDDATCIHHPRKKATAICAGSGDYICSLCAVELDGQTYSAEYLNTGGKDKVEKAFDRYLPRPDGQIVLYFLFCLIPYINFIFIPFAVLWIPHAFYCYVKALHLRKTDELFRRVMGSVSVVTLPIILVLLAVLWCIGAFALVAFWTFPTRRYR